MMRFSVSYELIYVSQLLSLVLLRAVLSKESRTPSEPEPELTGSFLRLISRDSISG